MTPPRECGVTAKRTNAWSTPGVTDQFSSSGDERAGEGGGGRGPCPLALNPRAPCSQRGLWGLCSCNSSQELELWPRDLPLCSWQKEFSSEWLPCTDPLIRVPVRACDSHFLLPVQEGVGSQLGGRPAGLVSCSLAGYPGDSVRAREPASFPFPAPSCSCFSQEHWASASLQKSNVLGAKTNGQMPPV